MKISLNFVGILLLLLAFDNFRSLDATPGKHIKSFSSRSRASSSTTVKPRSNSDKENTTLKPGTKLYDVKSMPGGGLAKFYETPPIGFINTNSKLRESALEMINRPQVLTLIQGQSAATGSKTLIGNNPKQKPKDLARLDDQGTALIRPNNFQLQKNGVTPGHHSTFGHTLADRTITKEKPTYILRALDRSINHGVGTIIRHTNSPGSSPNPNYGSTSSSDTGYRGRRL